MIKDKFDKIFCLHLGTAKDREHCVSEIVEKTGAEVWYTQKIIPINDKFTESLSENFFHHVKNKDGMLNSYSCALGHYGIVSTAYNTGCRNVLVLEDDVVPTEDMEKIFDNMPEDYNILRIFVPNYDGGTYSIKYNDYFFESDAHSPGTMAYALDRKGMRWYLDSMERWFTYADTPFWDINKKTKGDLKQYYCFKNPFDGQTDESYKTLIGYDKLNKPIDEQE